MAAHLLSNFLETSVKGNSWVMHRNVELDTWDPDQNQPF